MLQLPLEGEEGRGRVRGVRQGSGLRQRKGGEGEGETEVGITRAIGGRTIVSKNFLHLI